MLTIFYINVNFTLNRILNNHWIILLIIRIFLLRKRKQIIYVYYTYIVDQLMRIISIDCNNNKLKEKNPSYYTYFFLHSFVVLSRYFSTRTAITILTPGKLTTMSHTDDSIYLRSRIFLQLGKGSAWKTSARGASRVRSETINEILTSVKSTRRLKSGPVFTLRSKRIHFRDISLYNTVFIHIRSFIFTLLLINTINHITKFLDLN